MNILDSVYGSSLGFVSQDISVHVACDDGDKPVACGLQKNDTLNVGVKMVASVDLFSDEFLLRCQSASPSASSGSASPHDESSLSSNEGCVKGEKHDLPRKEPPPVNWLLKTAEWKQTWRQRKRSSYSPTEDLPPIWAASVAKQLQECLGNDIYVNKIPHFETNDIVLKKKLGEGIHGAVFTADFCGSIAAMKVLPMRGHDQIIRSARDELETLATFRDHPHPGILKVMGYGVKDRDIGNNGKAGTKRWHPQVYIASEFHNFGTLRDFLILATRAGKKTMESVLSPPIRMGLCVDLLNALHHFHTHSQRVHLDLKPDNILMSCTGRLVIGDFGWARTLESLKQSDLCVACAPGYSGPEVQCIGGKDIHQSTDIYSIAVILCQILRCSCFHRVHEETIIMQHNAELEALVNQNAIDAVDYDVIVEHMRKCAKRPYILPSNHVSVDVEEVLKAMLHPSPESRPTAREAAVQLSTIAKREWPHWCPDKIRLDECGWKKVFSDIEITL